MKLNPYLNFPGNCEDAINYYAECFKGSVEQVSRYETAPFPISEDYRNKVLHSIVKFGDNIIMACDQFPGSTPVSGNQIVLSISSEDEEESKRLFDRLSQGGSVTMPLERQFWGDLFGQVTDRYGISWMVSCPSGS